MCTAIPFVLPHLVASDLSGDTKARPVPRSALTDWGKMPRRFQAAKSDAEKDFNPFGCHRFSHIFSDTNIPFSPCAVDELCLACES